MQTRDLKNNEVAMLLLGLRTIYVADDEETRQRMIKRLEAELAARGLALKEDVTHD